MSRLSSLRIGQAIPMLQHPRMTALMEKTINAALLIRQKDRGTSIDHVSVTSDATNKSFPLLVVMKGTGASSIGFDQSAKPSTNKTVLGIVVGVTDTQTTTATHLQPNY